MEIRMIEKKALVLDKGEIEKLKVCFNYLYHRSSCHPSSYPGRTVILPKFIQYVRSILEDL